jgi:hypothetical protein
MRFLECVDLNPKIVMIKGQIYPFVEMANVSTCYRSPDNVDTKPFDSGVKFQDGDTVIARITPCLQNGKRFYCQNIGTGFGSTEYLVFRPKNDSVDSKYLYYFMMTDFIKLSMINSMTGATGRQRVNNDVFNNIEVCFPDINIQRKIGEILSSYDNLIENNQKQIKLLEEAAQRLYKEWFVDLRFPGHEDVEIVDGLPEGWNYTTVHSFIKLQSGYAFKSKSFDNTGKFKIVTIKNVQDGKFDGNNVNRIVEIPTKMPSHCKLIEGDTLLSLTGNVGRICTVIGSDYLLNQRVAKIASDYPSYAYYLFSSKKMFHDMNNLANGAAQQNLSPIRTGQMQILKPSEDILLRFEEMTKPLIDKKILLNKSMITATQSRDRLLPKLMSGEIQV